MAAVVGVEQGKLRGKTSLDYKGEQFYIFHGIPYAKPPLGELRFKAPLPPEPWDDVRDATKEPTESLSKHFIYQGIMTGSEDCLYLNVFTPELPNENTNKLKPVMFWIHGGGFTMGSSKVELYGPEYLITGDIVLVTINYRLGALGFLRFEDPSLGVPGNAGMKDVVMALKWVQRNIHNFCGDPKNVTIFGESAGGAAVHSLILSPMAKGLFHRAILQSGCILNPWVFGKSDVKNLAKVLGLESENEREILEFLMKLSGEKIFKGQNKIPDPFDAHIMRPFGLSVETNAKEPAFLSEHPVTIMKSGNYNKVPMMIGYTDREGMFSEYEHMLKYGQIKPCENFEEKIPFSYNVGKGTGLSKTIAQKIKYAYYESKGRPVDDPDTFYLLETDLHFLRGIYETIQLHLSSSTNPIYFYRLSADTSLNVVKKLLGIDNPGVCHADDLGYLFKNQMGSEVAPDSIEDVMIRRMVKLWTNFALTGNPNPEKPDPDINVTWKPVQINDFKTLDINTRLSFIVNSDLERMRTWDEIKNMLPNSKL